MSEPRVLVDARNILGEGPVWSADEACLYWVDIKGRALHRCDAQGGHHRTWELPTRASALSPRASGGLLLATEDGFANFDTETGELTLVTPLEEALPRNRSNEGKGDRQGRFWCGTMDDGEENRSGALYRYDPDGTVTQHVDGVGISNTLAWSPDDRWLYFADSLEQTLYRFAFDADTGTVSDREVFATTRGEDWTPDGATIDAEGYLWSCQWDGWRVVRYAPDGSVDRVIPLPVQRPTSCIFGGPDMSTLFITSARVGLDDAALETQPAAGAILALDTDTQGIPEVPFGG